MAQAKINKFQHFRQLLERIDQAYGAGFYLECVWLEYAFLEGRIDSVILKSGIVLKKKTPMFGDKIQAVIEKQPAETLLATSFDPVELVAIVDWKNKRNKLMHELADDLRPWLELNSEIQALAKEGRELSRSLAASVRRYKRRWKRASEKQTASVT